MIDTAGTLKQRAARIETPITLSVSGRVVNAPGEALDEDISVPGLLACRSDMTRQPKVASGAEP